MDNIWLAVMPCIAAILFGGVIYILGARCPPEVMVGAGRQFKGMLKRSKRYSAISERLNDYLIKNGAAFHYGRGITVSKMIICTVLLAALGWVVGLRINIAISLVAAILGGGLLWILPTMMNKSDNEKMLPDLRMIYHALEVQIKAGVYVTDAMTENYASVRNIRLKSALLELGSDIVMKNDLFSALERFQAKFDNRYIDSLCIIILQAMESGQAVELLGDIAEQVRDMEKAVLDRKKSKLDRSITFYQLGMLAAVLAVALYACISYMMNEAIGI